MSQCGYDINDGRELTNNVQRIARLQSRRGNGVPDQIPSGYDDRSLVSARVSRLAR